MRDKLLGKYIITDKDEKIKLEDLNKIIVLYFYPKDNTPGCTLQAKSMQEVYSDLKDYDVEVIGINIQGKKDHLKFRENNNLQFILACDEEKELVNIFECYGIKKMFGKEYYGIFRKTFILDENLNLIKKFDKVTVKSHGQDVLKFIKKYKKIK